MISKTHFRLLLPIIGDTFVTSSRVNSYISWSLTASRGYKAHRVNRPNLAQPIDVNTLDLLINRTTNPASALLPILKNLAYLNPRQTTSMLEKLPRMGMLHRHRTTGGSGLGHGNDTWPQVQREAYSALMGVLRRRLTEVLADCSPDQLQRAFWGLTMSEHSAAGATSTNGWVSAPLGISSVRLAKYFLNAFAIKFSSLSVFTLGHQPRCMKSLCPRELIDIGFSIIFVNNVEKGNLVWKIQSGEAGQS